MPDWVQAERTQFEQVRDKDANGFMDKNEIREWLFPNDYNHLDTEAKHLITESDDDRVSQSQTFTCFEFDRKLTRFPLNVATSFYCGSNLDHFKILVDLDGQKPLKNDFFYWLLENQCRQQPALSK